MMHKKNIKMRYNILHLVIVVVTFFSCNNQNKITNKNKQSSKAFDSIVYKTELSGTKLRIYISFLKHGKRYEKFRSFVKTGDFYSEQYAIKYYIKGQVKTVCSATSWYVEEGYKQLQRAEHYQRSSRKMLLILILTCLFVLLVILLLIFKVR